ncbi:MAG TPA: carboxypeptidase-like regulatory domain-containing protein [Gemmatimonadaceae bacterium]|nr:carboxypeptidase-like regulatory domain-containing protein [Gemmatimonadaceae bacterium]
MQHLDEGTIHTWLDGELSPDESAKVEAHAAECAECRAHVAEARGLIAASTRILNALDNVASNVIPPSAQEESVASIPRIARAKRWYDRTDIRAAAAILLVAGTSLVVVKSQRNTKATAGLAIATDRAVPLAARTESSSASPRVYARSLEENQSREQRAAPGSTTAPTPVEPGKKAAASVSGIGALGAGSRDEAVGNRFAQPPSNVAEAAVAAPPPARITAPQSMSKTLDATAAATSVMADAVRQSVRGRVDGRVTTDRGLAVPGATVTVQGTNLGATTDTSGKFRLENVPAGEQRLLVRRIGYEAKTLPVSVNDSITVPTLALKPSMNALSEIVVTGIGSSAERMSVGAAAAGPGIRKVRADTTGTTRQEVYEVSPGVQVTLVETVDGAAESDLASQRAKQSVAAKDSARPTASTPAPPRVPNNTITWRNGNRRYSLTGPLSTRQLEAIKTQLMKTRR